MFGLWVEAEEKRTGLERWVDEGLLPAVHQSLTVGLGRKPKNLDRPILGAR